MSITPVLQTLKPYQELIEKAIKKHITTFGPKTPLRDACEYALLNGGKRFRPSLVLMIAKAIGHNVDVTEAALAVEYFHTASLIADDLPCMDNDDERRHKPSTHKVFGDSVALLATYALISAGYESLTKNADGVRKGGYPFSHLSDKLCVLAVENASINTGILGATGGQFMDLTPPDLSPKTLIDVLRKKTVTLFEISFVLGWLYGGGEIAKLPQVKKCAEHFGLAFQIADDIQDQQQDIDNKRAINLANVLGRDEAKNLFHVEIKAFKNALRELNIYNQEMTGLLSFLLI